VACVVVLVGVAWRVWGLDAFPGLDSDEVEGVLAWLRDPPLYLYVYPSGRPHLNVLAPLLHWPFEALFGPAAWTVRLPALLLGVATIPTTYLMFKRPFGREVAWSAAVLVSAAPFLVAYSRVSWDPAFIPVFSVLLIGLAFNRRWWATGVCAALLAVIHPTTLCLLPLAAAPLIRDQWVMAAHRPRPVWWRVALATAGVAAYLGIYVGLAVISHSVGWGSPETFAAMVWEGLTGAVVYAEFLGATHALTLDWRALTAGALCLAGGVILWRQAAWDRRLVLVGVVLGLLGQFISFGTEDLLTPLRARYFLWAMVPLCLLVAMVAQAVATRVRAPQAASWLCIGLATVWLWTFHTQYLDTFVRTGGTSPTLDYRAATVQPKQLVLDAIRRHIGASDQTVTLFVGEPRLHLALTYLASEDPRIDVQNLGARLYSHQNDGHDRLRRDFQSRAAPALFVDYDWDHLDGHVREIHALAARPVSAAVAPWTPTPLTTITTADGRPLLTIWRLEAR
jgi:4-amino-4-deoxy-L-arabinose transferase-like glycosyltransferase